MGGSIFISYRRGEDRWFAGRLYDRLERTFRRPRLFMDVDCIAPGQDFISILEARVAECDVLLALIGRGWLTATDAAGRRRLDNPEDFVRIEAASGLAQGKRVIPLLIDDAPMPAADELPENLKPLARRHALPLSQGRFKADADRLIRALKQALADAEKARAASATVPSPGPAGPSFPQAGGATTPEGTPTIPHSGAGLHAALTSPSEMPRQKVAPKPVAARALEDLEVFRDVDAPWCPEMVALPLGEFLMGSPENDNDKEGYGDEWPQHRVTIGTRFAIGRYMVTFEEYDRLGDDTKGKSPRTKAGAGGGGR